MPAPNCPPTGLTASIPTSRNTSSSSKSTLRLRGGSAADAGNPNDGHVIAFHQLVQLDVGTNGGFSSYFDCLTPVVFPPMVQQTADAAAPFVPDTVSLPGP